MNWIIVKALNKHEDLAIRYDNSNFYITKVWLDKELKFSSNVLSFAIKDAELLLDKIEDVMLKRVNKIYAYNRMRKQDIHLKLIAYNSGFKLRDTLKLELYDYIGVNESTYSSVTLSKEGARNLYRTLLAIKRLAY